MAIRHGHSKAGNDHIHIAASMVREDGTKWSSWRDFPRAQQAARGLEKKYGLEELSPTHSTRGLRPGRGPSEVDITGERCKSSGGATLDRLI